jgi:hypothetical protein
MPWLDPGIHDFLAHGQDMDGRVKPGHDALILPGQRAFSPEIRGDWR